MAENNGPTAAPPADQIAAANKFWAGIDERVDNRINGNIQENLGIPRNRVITINIPLASATSTPSAGWLTSIFVDSPIRIVGWQIHALGPGTVTIDIQYSSIQVDPLTEPLLVSLPGLVENFPSLNGYTVASQNTTAWFQRDLLSGVLNIIVVEATGILAAVMGLECIDLGSRVLQR